VFLVSSHLVASSPRASSCIERIELEAHWCYCLHWYKIRLQFWWTVTFELFQASWAWLLRRLAPISPAVPSRNFVIVTQSLLSIVPVQILSIDIDFTDIIDRCFLWEALPCSHWSIVVLCTHTSSLMPSVQVCETPCLCLYLYAVPENRENVATRSRKSSK